MANESIDEIDVFEGEELSTVLEDLDGSFKNTDIAIACGYFTLNQKGEKLADIASYKEAREEADAPPMEEDESRLCIDGDGGYEIFNGKICILDENHSGTIFVPKRIVEKKKDPCNYYDEFEDCDIEWIKCDPFNEGISDEDAQKKLDAYGFSEPMMWFSIDNYSYVDSELDSYDWFSYEELAEYYEIDFNDVHEKSVWREG